MITYSPGYRSGFLSLGRKVLKYTPAVYEAVNEMICVSTRSDVVTFDFHHINTVMNNMLVTRCDPLYNI